MHPCASRFSHMRQAGNEGYIALEFVVILMAAFTLLVPVGEFFRLSLFDQALARATHLGARAAAYDPTACDQAVSDAFGSDFMSRWLLDLNDDGFVMVLPAAPGGSDTWPSGGSLDEVHILVQADDDLYDGSNWEIDGTCGGRGSWIQVRARIVVDPWFPPLRTFWPNGIRRQHESWARNQR